MTIFRDVKIIFSETKLDLTQAAHGYSFIMIPYKIVIFYVE